MGEIEDYLRKSPDYRLDESDGKFFRYERYPSSRLNYEFMIETSCGEYQIFTFPYEPSQKWREKDSEEVEIIEARNPEQSNFRRDILLWINHRSENHIIQFVIDQKSQNHGNGEIIGPHLNPRPEDEENLQSCEQCRKLFSELLDHYEVKFEEKENYKVIDFDNTLSNLEEKLIQTLNDFYDIES